MSMDWWQFVFDTVSFWVDALLLWSFTDWLFSGFGIKYPNED